MLPKNRKCHPCKIQVAHQLKPQDRASRLNFALEFGVIVQENYIVLNNLFMSDEAHFHLNGFTNKYNFRYWSHTNPTALHERPLHCEKVTLRCAVSAVVIIDPYFFEDVNERAVKVNGERYRQMLHRFRGALNRDDIWFQQDGATALTARYTLRLLKNFFPGRKISRSGDINWPARSQDLTAADFFFFGDTSKQACFKPDHTLSRI